ncbi:MAG: hypothetical protein JNK22_08820 [Rhodocyclaceae bacterium]|nr:hypothetical protein [Rhodocyclaceae bacterium]
MASAHFFTKGCGGSVVSDDRGRIGSLKFGGSPVRVFREATPLAFSSGVDIMPSWIRAMLSTAPGRVLATPSRP